MEAFFAWFWATFMVVPSCISPGGSLGAFYTLGLIAAALASGFIVAACCMGEGTFDDTAPAAWLGFFIILVATSAAFLWLGTRAAAWLLDLAVSLWTAFSASYGAHLVAFGVACWAVGFLCCLLCRARAWANPRREGK